MLSAIAVIKRRKVLLRRLRRRPPPCSAASPRRSARWRTRTRSGPLRSEWEPLWRMSRQKCRPLAPTVCRALTTIMIVAVHQLCPSRLLFRRRSRWTKALTAIGTTRTNAPLNVLTLLTKQTQPSRRSRFKKIKKMEGTFLHVMLMNGLLWLI